MNRLFNEFHFVDFETVNDAVAADYLKLRDAGKVRKSHLFSGRYENIYIDRGQIAGLSILIPFWLASATEVLGLKADALRCGFWFNDMQPGDVTLPHSHDDDDEWLSGVYYLKVPENSGALILHTEGRQESIQAEPGKLVLFSSSNVHEVEKNRSQETRLSIGINFGSVSSPNTPPGE